MLRPALPYVGRFAPSPTGLLHLGSLTCALASFLDARRHGGRWLLRIEDIDPPREQPGAAQSIIRCLAAHGMESDAEIVWQSQRSQAYNECLQWLQEQDLVYPCNCSRQRLAALQGKYDGFCRHHSPSPPSALRLKVQNRPPAFSEIDSNIEFTDRHLGLQREDLATSGDFIVHRKDGLFAYQLAVVVDDIAQGVTQVVRGNDILDTTARQLYLFQLLRQKAPTYCHIPVISNATGQKLSKQNQAPAIDIANPSVNLYRSLVGLGAKPPMELSRESPDTLLRWAVEHWSVDQLPHSRSVAEATLHTALS